MNRILAVIDLASSSVPVSQIGSFLSRRIAGETLLHLLVSRISESQRVHDFVVVADSDTICEEVVSLVPSHVHLRCSNNSTLLSRLQQVAQVYKPFGVVLIDPCQPLTDADLIDSLVGASLLSNADYAAFGSRQLEERSLEDVGLFSEWYSKACIEQLSQQRLGGSSLVDLRRLASQLKSPMRKRFFEPPMQLDRSDFRLRCVTTEDIEHVQLVVEALGASHCSWSRIAELLSSQGEILERMASLNSQFRLAV